VAFVGIIVNVCCSLLFTRGMSDLNIRTAFWHLMADAIVLIGVVISTIIVAYTGWNWMDPAVGLASVVIVLVGTWGLLRDSLHLILDAVPRYIDQRGVKTYLTHLSGVKAVHDLHIWGLSTREVALTAHLIMPEERLSDADFRRINDHLHDKFNINHVTLQVETGSTDDPCHRLESC
jgi:cobalt-zinc-cadmium efflux system protein